jgi:pyridoxal phosphate enzyme (YggS family)
MITRLENSYHSVASRIHKLASQHDRKPQDISLLAVSKGHSADAIRTLYERCGHRDFGENYAQELIAKQQQLEDLREIRWHFIGQLQTNKISKLVPICHHIATVASEKHLLTITRIAREHGFKSYPVSILVNAENEPQKAGVSFAEAAGLAESLKLSREGILMLHSMMAIPSSLYQDSQYPQLPQIYRDLKDLANTHSSGRLSLGMSGDLLLAIAAGSTTVRIGTAIFGERRSSQN